MLKWPKELLYDSWGQINNLTIKHFYEQKCYYDHLEKSYGKGHQILLMTYTKKLKTKS